MIRKVAEKTGGIKEERIYLGSYEIYRKFVSGSLTIERTTVHISDDTGRIAMLEERTVGSDAAPASLQRYIYSNHLQSASLELDENADIISYEEYHPFGTTAYQASNSAINALAKRYRYTGKERDEETGLYYHGARYYIPWLARWSASDPMENKYAGMSPYNYSMNNPVMMNDPNGADPQIQTVNPPPSDDDDSDIASTSEFTIFGRAKPGGDPNTISPIKGSVSFNGTDAMYQIRDKSSGNGESRDYWISARQGADFNTQYSFYDDLSKTWQPYWNNKEVYETTMKAVDDTKKAFVVGLYVTGSLPFVAVSGLFSTGLTYASVGSGAGNFGGQMITNEGSFKKRIDNVNWIGVASATILKNPLGEELVGNAFSVTKEEGFNIINFQDGGKDFLINVTVGTAIGKYVDFGLDKSFGQSLKAETKGLLKSGTANTIEGVSSGLINITTETTENLFTKHIKSKYGENKK